MDTEKAGLVKKKPETKANFTVDQLQTELEEAKRANLEIKRTLAETEGRLRAVTDNSFDLSYIINREGRCVYASPYLCRFTNFEEEDILGSKPGTFIHTDDMIIVNNVIQKALANPNTPVSIPDHRVRHEDFRWFYFEGVAVSMPDALGVQGILFSCYDVTERKSYELKLYHKANYDGLTSLPNRSLFTDRLTRSVGMARRHKSTMAMMMVDLDGFKEVNDTYGHVAGDILLNEAAARIKQCIREADTVARLGGDEFAVILTSIAKAEDGSTVASKILDALSKLFDIEGDLISISGSIGISIHPIDADNVEDLIKHSDAAMYESKASGKNTFHYYTEYMNSNSQERMSLDHDLRRAIENNEFILHYQPIIDSVSSEIVSCEALIRWQHPTKGFIPPDVFIPFCEEKGHIIPIGAWVLEEACKFLSIVQKKFKTLPITVAVNVSPRQCHETGFVQMVRQIVENYEISPAHLTIEVTEGMFIGDNENVVLDVLKELRNFGIQLSLDDFGTGYSSLSYLKRFSVDYLKIDRSFIREIESSHEDRALVDAMLSMAHSLSLTVVAEGVETYGQLELMRTMGCDRIQGFHVSKPIVQAEFLSFLEHH